MHYLALYLLCYNYDNFSHAIIHRIINDETVTIRILNKMIIMIIQEYVIK